MGAVCYKPRPTTISKDDILRALKDKHLKESITEPDVVKTFKTDELPGSTHMQTFGSMSQYLNQDDNAPLITKGDFTKATTPNRNVHLSQAGKQFGQLELNILTYYGYKEDIYDTLIGMSRKSLYFLQKNQRKLENKTSLRHSNERIRILPVKSIEEHSSGVNQLLKISNKELVTASDDCYMKFWSSNTMKVEGSIATETITCIALTGGSGKQKDILVAGCHSGNLLMISCALRMKKEQINNAHYNLIRVIVTLEALKNRFFVTADVCGIVKVWASQFKATQVMEIEQEGAISYNSMIEVTDFLPKRSSYEEAAVIACALKSQKINLILLLPVQGQFQIIKTLRTELKPTCLIQLSSKHLAIAVGSLKEDSIIEIHDMNKSKIISRLAHHKDMIDSMLKVEFPSEKIKSNNPYITWILSASRDRQIVLWKLIDGKIMKRSYNSLSVSNKKQGPQTTSINGVRSVQQLRNKIPINTPSQNPQTINRNRKHQKQNRPGVHENDEADGLLDHDHLQNEDQDEAVDDEELDSQDENQDNNAVLDEETKEIDPSSSSSLKKNANGNPVDKQIDYYYSFDTGHKDFVRSMVQINGGSTLVTASEDKTIKLFTIAF